MAPLLPIAWPFRVSEALADQMAGDEAVEIPDAPSGATIYLLEGIKTPLSEVSLHHWSMCHCHS